MAGSSLLALLDDIAPVSGGPARGEAKAATRNALMVSGFFSELENNLQRKSRLFGKIGLMFPLMDLLIL